jgi:hypothetical protein
MFRRVVELLVNAAHGVGTILGYLVVGFLAFACFVGVFFFDVLAPALLAAASLLLLYYVIFRM